MTAAGDPDIRAAVAGYYTAKVAEHGPVAKGVDWSSEDSQRLRFDVLLGVGDGLPAGFSLLDYGCGYGALLSHLRDRGHRADYRGFDLSPLMIEAARGLHPGEAGRFADPGEDPAAADAVVASGIFNVRLDCPASRWEQYVLDTLDHLDALSIRGFAFNVLTSYSDADKRRPDLYYAEPHRLFDHCKRKYSRRVALLHDYPLWEFTIIVRKG